MRPLIAVEARRYTSRRLVRVLMALAVLGIVIGATVMFFRSQRLTPAQTRAEVQAAQIRHRQQIQRCSAGEFGIPPSQIPPGKTLPQFCQDIAGRPQIQDKAFHLTDLRAASLGVSHVLIALFLLLGASFIGAEWHAGTMTTLLTWEPRRVRVLAAKVGVAAAMAFAGTIFLLLILGLALVPVATLHGTTVGADATWLRGLMGLALRAGATAAIAATLGGALASIGRNTAAALGVAFGYLAILEPLLRGLRPGWSSWLVANNVGTFVEGTRNLNEGFASRSPIAAGVLVGIYTIGLAVIAASMFRARDVT
ncbi:MAG TPA: hypothetical protein VF972_05495 [Actinomycetota bacterium]